MEMLSVVLPILCLMTNRISATTACLITVLIFGSVFCAGIVNLKPRRALGHLQSMTQLRLRHSNCSNGYIFIGT